MFFWKNKKQIIYTFAQKDNTYTRAQKSTLSLSSQNNPKNFFGGFSSSFALGAFLLFFLASASLFARSIFFLRSSCILRISSGFISGPNPPKALILMATFLLLLFLLLFFRFRCCCWTLVETSEEEAVSVVVVVVIVRVCVALSLSRGDFFCYDEIGKIFATHAPLFFSSSHEKNSPNYAQTWAGKTTIKTKTKTKTDEKTSSVFFSPCLRRNELEVRVVVAAEERKEKSSY